MEKDKNNIKNFIIPTISALEHISSLVLDNEEEINLWQTGRAVKVDTSYYIENKNNLNFKKVIKVIDDKKTLLGIGFLNKEDAYINPKLVLNAK